MTELYSSNKAVLTYGTSDIGRALDNALAAQVRFMYRPRQELAVRLYCYKSKTRL